MTEEAQIPAQVSNEKNKNNVRCQFCQSLMLKAQQGVYLEDEFRLPLMHQKNSKDAQSMDTELQRHFWVVDDMFTFENIGFSNTVDNHKFLTCADCEMGPVGYHEINTKKCFIALKRVRHENELSSEPVGALKTPTVYT